ncbi:hypothetical protein HA48_19530 [Pantoea wallisii]|uniref:Uncharacterized protein n=1 Tax=Pantoea wallisii TaxID=1076551 RepID=A0A1X1CXT8_9GAMM|nr:hypothetical protein [Pantoea wallisii]ORM69177.1 hypothetical protein HA48_19530 [Pantoea wallisii]
MNDIPKKIKFSPKRTPVIPEHRVLYKISQLVIILKETCRGSKASISKINLINWALKEESRIDSLLVSKVTKVLKINSWSYDPALVRAIDLAYSDRLITFKNGAFALTKLGLIFADKIISEGEFMKNDLILLKKIGKSITESMIKDVERNWRTLDVH